MNNRRKNPERKIHNVNSIVAILKRLFNIITILSILFMFAWMVNQ